MKSLLVTCALLCSSLAGAAEKAVAIPAQPLGAVHGEVLEVNDVAGYTYLRLKADGGDTWAAVPTTAVKKGAQVSIDNGSVMTNFESKALHKTFPRIIFGTIGKGAANAPAAGAVSASARPPAAAVPAAPDAKVSKAGGPDGRTVAEVLAKGAELKDKTVLVHGKIVKYTADVMGKNWIHLRDGSGAAADKTNDIVVTTANRAKLGDIVNVKGVVHVDKDLGAGYFFKTLIEEATLQP